MSNENKVYAGLVAAVAVCALFLGVDAHADGRARDEAVQGIADERLCAEYGYCG